MKAMLIKDWKLMKGQKQFILYLMYISGCVCEQPVIISDF